MKTLIKIKFTTLYISLLITLICFAFTFQVIGTGFAAIGLFSAISLQHQIREMYRI